MGYLQEKSDLVVKKGDDPTGGCLSSLTDVKSSSGNFRPNNIFLQQLLKFSFIFQG